MRDLNHSADWFGLKVGKKGFVSRWQIYLGIGAVDDIEDSDFNKNREIFLKLRLSRDFKRTISLLVDLQSLRMDCPSTLIQISIFHTG